MELFGRDGDLRRLREIVDRPGTVTTLVGEPGSGKTALLRETASYARTAGLRVLAGTTLRDLLAPLLDAASALPVPHRRALTAAEQVPFRLAVATVELLASAAADRPLVLLLDDVQHLDPAGRQTVAFVARRIAADPIVMLAARRADCPGLGTPELEVAPLNDATARLLLERRASGLDGAVRERIMREAAGNPLALIELAAAWRFGGEPGSWAPLPVTATLERAFAPHLRGLPQPARDVLLATAVDEAGDLAEILATAAQTIEAVEPALDLVQPEGVRLRFRHPVLRSVVLAAEQPARHRAVHAAFANAAADPKRRVWHQAMSVEGPDEALAAELARHDHLPALERAAQLTSTAAKRAKWRLRAAEQAHELGRAELAEALVRDCAGDPLRAAWLREVCLVRPDPVRLLGLGAVAMAAGDDNLALHLCLRRPTRAASPPYAPGWRRSPIDWTRPTRGISPRSRWPSPSTEAPPSPPVGGVAASKPRRAAAARPGGACDRRPGPGGRPARTHGISAPSGRPVRRAAASAGRARQ